MSHLKNMEDMLVTLAAGVRRTSDAFDQALEVVRAQRAVQPDVDDGKSRSKKRKTRDLSGFDVFSTEQRSRLKVENPDLKFGPMSKVISSEWKLLNEEQRGQYRENARNEQTRRNALNEDDADQDKVPRKRKRKKGDPPKKKHKAVAAAAASTSNQPVQVKASEDEEHPTTQNAAQAAGPGSSSEEDEE
jgi:hypothetical protein